MPKHIKIPIITDEMVMNKIYHISRQKVMLDFDLAKLYHQVPVFTRMRALPMTYKNIYLQQGINKVHKMRTLLKLIIPLP